MTKSLVLAILHHFVFGYDWALSFCVGIVKTNFTDYYVQLVNLESNDYTSATARAIQEAQILVEAGFEYVCDFEDFKLFRKRK